MKLRAGRKDVDMTSGVIWQQLLSFSVPLVIGYLFQQMYNTVDSVVVGQFVGKEALAAVGSVGPISNTLIGFFMGLAAGAGVAVSQAYGAGDQRGIHDAVHASLFMTLVMTVFCTVLGVLMVPWMLTLMSIPDDVRPDATTYLRIYFAGSTGLLFYNMGSGILRAVGDTRRPLYFLVFCAVTNTVLDLLLVVCFRMGTAGVALATLISQLLSAVLVMAVLIRSDSGYRVIPGDVRLYPAMMQKIIRIGIPTAIQQAVTSFSNVFVQGYINHFGSSCMAGWSSYNKLDTLIMLPMQGIALAATTFSGQNYGAGNSKRARRGNYTAWGMGELGTILLMIPVMVLAPQLVRLFNADEQVVHYGALFIRLLTPFYVLCVTNQIYAGTLRGAGATAVPTMIMLGSFVVSRQIYLFIMSRVCNTEIAIAMGYPFGWVLASVLCLIYYHFGHWDPTLRIKKSVS